MKNIPFACRLVALIATIFSCWSMQTNKPEQVAAFFTLQQQRAYSAEFSNIFKHEIKNALRITEIYHELTKNPTAISSETRNKINALNRLPEKVEVTNEARNINALEYAKNFVDRCKQFEQDHLREPETKSLKNLRRATLLGVITTLLLGSTFFAYNEKNTAISTSFWTSALGTTIVGTIYGARLMMINKKINAQNDLQSVQNMRSAFTTAAQLIKNNSVRYN